MTGLHHLLITFHKIVLQFYLDCILVFWKHWQQNFYYSNIHFQNDFLKANSNDWKAINKGIEKYGNEFTINGYTKSKQYDEKDTKIDKEVVI